MANFIVFALACFLGGVATAVTLMTADGLLAEARFQISQCEKTLPRTEHCILKAEPSPMTAKRDLSQRQAGDK